MDKRERIRSVFLHPVESYYLGEAATLLGVSRRALIREAVSDRPEEYRDGRRWRFTWRQLAYVAFRTWTLAEIHEALGAEAAKTLPPLLAIRAVTVRLPEYMVRALEAVAAENKTTLDGALHGELIDFAGSRSEEMDAAIPGFRRAYLFPGRE